MTRIYLTRWSELIVPDLASRCRERGLDVRVDRYEQVFMVDSLLFKPSYNDKVLFVRRRPRRVTVEQWAILKGIVQEFTHPGPWKMRWLPSAPPVE